MNKMGAGLNNTTGENLYKTKTKCWDHFKTTDCKTQNCACSQSMQTGREVNRETNARPGNLNLDISYTGVPLKNKDGNTIGAFEVVVDQTEIKTASRLAAKVALYQEKETEKVAENLVKLSNGNTDFTAKSFEADTDTTETKEKFDMINEALNQCVSSINSLVIDADMLSKAAIEGKLATRADASKHEGDYAKIIKGVNETLDAVIGPLNVAAEYIERISKGDMPELIKIVYQGEFNVIKENVNSLITAQNQIIEKATLISNGDLSVELKRRSEKDDLMQSLNDMVKATSRIIDEFRSATNGIANAGVEISTSHGKGFAVVASEVRKLAERSKVAADEIDELSKSGVDISVEAGEQLSGIVPEIEKTAQLVQEIAAASIEMNSGAGQVNNAIQQLNTVTQQNAAASEEMATSSEELSSQADQLKDLIKFFKTGNELIDRTK